MAVLQDWYLGLRWVGLAGVYVSVAALSYAVASLPAPALPRLGLSGLRRRRALRDSGCFRAAEPLIRWLGERVDPMLPAAARRALARRIALAGDVAGMAPGELLALSALSAMAGALGAWSYGHLGGFGPWVPVLGACAGGVLPLTHLDTLRVTRQRHAFRGLPQVVDVLVLALSAGLDFPGALRQFVARSSDPRDALVEELQLVLHELELGKTRAQALEELAERLPTHAIREFVSAVLQAEKSGSPLAAALRTQAVVSRQRRSVRAEELAARAGARMMAPVAMCMVSILLLVGAPAYFAATSGLKGLR